MPPDVPQAIKRRILVGQALYALDALLSVWSTYWSIAFIVVIPLNYSVAPRLLPRSNTRSPINVSTLGQSACPIAGCTYIARKGHSGLTLKLSRNRVRTLVRMLGAQSRQAGGLHASFESASWLVGRG